MKNRPLIWLALLLIVCSACSPAEEPIPPTETPTQEPTSTSTATTTPTMTPTATQTSTPTRIPIPDGQIHSEEVLRFSFFAPYDYSVNTGIYLYDYSFAAIYQKTTHWTRAIILLDVDTTDLGSVPIEFVLSTMLSNLDFFEATAEETGEITPIMINDYDAVSADFTGETKGFPIKGQSVAYRTDENHVMVGIGWFDVSEGPNIWDYHGVDLFQYVLESIQFEE